MDLRQLTYYIINNVIDVTNNSAVVKKADMIAYKILVKQLHTLATILK